MWAPAAHPRGNWCTALSRQAAHSLVVGGETGNTAPRQEGGQTREFESNKSYTLFPLPFASVVPEAQPAALTLVPSFSDSPIPSPAGLYSAGSLRPNLSAWWVPFHFLFSSIFPVFAFHTREVSHSQPWEQPLPSYHLTETHPPRQMFSEGFKRCTFKDKKCQRTLLSLFTTSHKTGHGLSHCWDIQGTCSKCLSPAQGAEGRVMWCLPLTQDLNLNSPCYSPPLITLPYFGSVSKQR